MKHTLVTALALILTATSLAASTRNDDSCDIAALPAATLLLPYFEVDLQKSDEHALTTLFTVVNVGPRPQIANVTLWSDWAYPVLSFDLFLTGYDVQSVNLRDVLVRGMLSPAGSGARRGPRSAETNPRHASDAPILCAAAPPSLAPPALDDLRAALTMGESSSCPGSAVGGRHERAIGYATIDLVSTCSSTLPTDPEYFDQILYDNILTGDYQIVSPDRALGNYAGGNPLVHLRAIPEGGEAGEVIPTTLPVTFYDRMFGSAESRRRADRRQPLPSSFVARYFQGAAFSTDLLLWREAMTPAGALCETYNVNRAVPLHPIVRFDERENATWDASFRRASSVASRVATTSSFFPALTSGDIGGWMYLNLDVGGTRQTQNWVVLHMSAEGRFSVAKDAAMLSNGCGPTSTSQWVVEGTSSNKQ